MHITFGLHLDAGVWPHPLHGHAAIAGFAMVGPLKFITLLETHLGHLAPPTPPSLRVAAFDQSLAEQDTESRFYHASFARDPWGVAAHLLSWHDQLTEAGWTHTPLATEGRLHDLTSLPPPLQPSLAQRIWTVAHALPPRQTFIDKVVLADPFEDLPRPWQALLTRLNVPTQPMAPVEPEPGLSDLHRLRHGQDLVADGSVLHLRGASPWDTAEHLAAWLAHHQPELGTVVVLCEGHGPTLDKALHRYNLPALGSHQASPWRPATQVLPLLLSLAWKPLDPHRLLEYLRLPQSPLPIGRFELARALLQSPGVAGDVWNQAWDAAVQYATRYVSTEGLDEVTATLRIQEAQAKDRDKLALWLGGLVPLGQVDRAEGMPVSLVRAAADRVAQWACAPDDAFLSAARGHAVAVQDALALCATDTLSATHLDQLLSQVTGHGTQRSVCPAEVGRFYAVHSPAAVLAPVDTVIWWHFVDAEPVPRPCPWTAVEQATLAAAGIVLTPMADTLRARARGWQRPLLAAQRRLVLASWMRDGVDPVQPHPLSRALPDTRPVQVSPAQAVHGHALPTVPLPPRPGLLPLPDWQVSPRLARARAKESATSIETLLQCPLQWTLHYNARLPSRPLTLPDQAQLFGILSHRILETVLTRTPLPDPAVAATEARALFAQLLPVMAAALLQPSRAMERRELEATVARAAEHLVGHLHASPYRVVGVEVRRQGTFGPSELEGTLDVLLEDRDTGAPAVLDLKWSSRTYRQKLQDGTAIQLAIYGHLVQPSDQPFFPAVAYYAVRDRRLLLPEGHRFDHGAVYGPSAGATLEATRRTHQARLADLLAGTIRATGHDDIKDDKVVDGTLVLKPPCVFCDYAPFCGRAEVDA